MKKFLLIMVMVCSFALAAFPALAIDLSLIPSTQTVIQGNTAFVDLMVSNVGSLPYGFSGFFVDIGYDSSILGITDADVTFGGTLGDPLLDTLADTTVPGVVSLLEASSFDIPTLTSLPDSFTLATLGFTGIGVGSSSLDFLFASLSDAYGYSYDLDPNVIVNTTGANVNVAPVPEPATMLLFGSGLIGFAFPRIKRKFRRA